MSARRSIFAVVGTLAAGVVAIKIGAPTETATFFVAFALGHVHGRAFAPPEASS